MRHALAALTLAVAAIGGAPAYADGLPPEPTDLRDAATAWYAAIDAGDAAKTTALFVSPDAAKRSAEVVASLRGHPLELGAPLRAAADDAAWLPVRSPMPFLFLVSWVRVDGAWRVSDVSRMAPELFLESPWVRPPLWPTPASGNEEGPLGAVYRLAALERDPDARRAATQKSLDEELFEPATTEDRATYPALLDVLASSRRLPGVLFVVGQAAGTVRLRFDTRSFELAVTRKEGRWKIVRATAEKPPEAATRATEADLAAAREVAVKALAAMEAKDAAAYGALALDRTKPTLTAMKPEAAKTALEEIAYRFGRGLGLVRGSPIGSSGAKRASVLVNAPERDSDWKKARIELVRLDAGWRVLDVVDGREVETVRGASAAEGK